MNMQEYNEIGKNVKIAIYDEKGRRLTNVARIIERPMIDYEDIRKGLKASPTGEIRYIDIATFEITKPFMTSKAKLFYSGKLVATREYPNIRMFKGDTLQLTYMLTICLDSLNSIGEREIMVK